MLVKVGDAPINPSDLGMMFAGSRLERATGGDGSVSTTVTAGLDAMAGRFGKPMPCGNEGGGTVIATDSRALQFAASPPHFDLGKSRDSYGPIGPVMVSPDLLPDRDAVAITCDVNDERRQDGSSADLIFDVSALIEYISAHATLEPGDIIWTGTPDGVGAASGKFLVTGDVITTTIEGIGTMRNVCR